jgi:hypothetical protein
MVELDPSMPTISFLITDAGPHFRGASRGREAQAELRWLADKDLPPQVSGCEGGGANRWRGAARTATCVLACWVQGACPGASCKPSTTAATESRLQGVGQS